MSLEESSHKPLPQSQIVGLAPDGATELLPGIPKPVWALSVTADRIRKAYHHKDYVFQFSITVWPTASKGGSLKQNVLSPITLWGDWCFHCPAWCQLDGCSHLGTWLGWNVPDVSLTWLPVNGSCPRARLRLPTKHPHVDSTLRLSSLRFGGRAAKGSTQKRKHPKELDRSSKASNGFTLETHSVISTSCWPDHSKG